MRAKSEPIPLKAGRRHELRVDYACGGSPSQMHLMWESDSQERRHVQTELLYPGSLESNPKSKP